MKTISVSVDDETHRLARIRAAETGTTVSAMMRNMLKELLKHPPERAPAETEHQRRVRMLDEVLARFDRGGNRAEGQRETDKGGNVQHSCASLTPTS